MSDYGFYDHPIAPGYWVHDLEHGGVDVLYNCPQDCPQLKDQLRNMVDTFPKAKYGRVKTNRILNQCRISPSKTIGGLSGRQRAELVNQLRR